MALLDFILNLAGLLLWLNWRAMGFKEHVPYRSTLVHTLKSAAPRRPGRWRYLAGLVTLLVIRGWLYGPIGSGLGWVPHLDLHVIAVPFRSDVPRRMMLFSLLSFGLTLAVFHLWLLLLSIANRHEPDSQPWQRLVRLQLGWAERMPWFGKLLLPLIGGVLIWVALQPLLVSLQMIPSGGTFRLLAEQGFVLGMAGLLTWKHLILGLLLFHLLNSYVYLGRSPLIDFASLSARNLLRPLGRLPLQVGRMDFAPTLGILLVWVAAEFVGRGLTELFRKLPF
jgi:uncharacterized protein YggT (Ycf19 family)